MRKTIQTLTLILALTGITYAGDMQQPVASPSPAPTVQGIMLQPLAGAIISVLETTLSLG